MTRLEGNWIPDDSGMTCLDNWIPDDSGMTCVDNWIPDDSGMTTRGVVT
jgi:hypothetical protein